MIQRTWLIGVVLLALAGCAHQQTRLQSDEDGEREKEPEIRTIGDVTSVANAEPIPVMGVGLVVGLEGTGGGAPPGGYRAMLEDQLRKRNYQDVKGILNSPNTSLVLVSAWIPAGARKGDRIDVEVSLPPQSKTTSLRGGILHETLLYNYDTARNLDPTYGGPDRALRGHAVARAEGPLQVGLGDGDETARLRQGRIWSGGRCNIDRPFYLVLNGDQQYSRMAQAVNDRINERFHGVQAGGPHSIAVAQNKAQVLLRVPPQYKHNLPRFLRVVRLIPLRERLDALRENRLAASGAGPGSVQVGSGSPYRRKLQEELLDPARTVTAALRLEALGEDSIAALKEGLKSDHVLVRFTSAEALAYLGSPSCGEELARIIEQQPVLRAYGLTALASLDEAVSHVKLRELLNAVSAETRYGAFRALWALDEHDQAVQGEQLNDSFWLHRTAPHAPPLVHLSSNRRPEIVLFGESPVLLPPFSLVAGDFTVTAGDGDDRCTLSRFSLRRGPSRRQCSLDLAEVLRTMAEMGAIYPDAVELLRQADRCKSLSCRVAVDALPQATSVYELAKGGATDPEFLKTDAEVLDARADFGATPTLFEKGMPAGRVRMPAHDDEGDEKTPRATERSKSDASD